jgi:hypothetical protein
MSGSFRPLVRLRRRAPALLRVLLPFVACGWLGAATPCPAMVATGADGAAREEPAEHAARGHHATHAAAGQHREATQTEEAHVRCPHCLPAALSGEAHDGNAHAHCGALDDLNDGARHHSAAKWDAKHVLPLASIAYASPVRAPAGVVRKVDRDYLHPPSVALNLRFCVLLI